MTLLSCGFFRDLVEPEVQSTGAFSGRVVWFKPSNAETLSIANATVTLDETSVLTDSDGRFSMTGTVTGNRTVTVSAVTQGFSAQQFPVRIGLSDSQWIFRINRQPPRIDGLSVLRPFKAGDNGRCDLSLWDSDSNVVGYQVDWGDGTGARNLVCTMFSQVHRDTNLVYRYLQDGFYTCRVTAFDLDGDSVRSQLVIAVGQQSLPQLDAISFNPETLWNSGTDSLLWITARLASAEGGYAGNIQWQYLSFGFVDTGSQTVLAYRNVYAGPFDSVSGRTGTLFSIRIPVAELPRVSDFADTLRNQARLPNDSTLTFTLLVQDGKSGRWGSAQGRVVNRR